MPLSTRKDFLEALEAVKPVSAKGKNTCAFSAGYAKKTARRLLQEQPDDAFDVGAYIAKLEEMSQSERYISRAGKCIRETKGQNPIEQFFLYGEALLCTPADAIMFCLGERDVQNQRAECLQSIARQLQNMQVLG